MVGWLNQRAAFCVSFHFPAQLMGQFMKMVMLKVVWSSTQEMSALKLTCHVSPAIFNMTQTLGDINQILSLFRNRRCSTILKKVVAPEI